jgi:large subunit ribosomal protein L37Ae
LVNSSIRYGASTRKLASAIKAQKIGKYKCDVCGRQEVRRISSSIWKCRHCGTAYAGGAYSLTTPPGVAVRAAIKGLVEKSK